MYYETLFWLLTTGTEWMELMGESPDVFHDRLRELGHVTDEKFVAHQLFDEMRQKEYEIRRWGNRSELFNYTPQFIDKVMNTTF